MDDRALPAPRVARAQRDTGRVAAVIVTYYTGAPLEECLRAAMSDPWIDQIILVDNGNPAPVSSRLRELCADRRNMVLLQGHGNIGFAAAANWGASKATCEWVLFLNPDAVIHKGAARALVETGRDALAPCIVGGRLLNPDGSEQRGARRDQITPWTAIVGFLGLGRLEKWNKAFRDPHREHDPPPAGPTPMPVVSGALMAMKKCHFEMLNGFDQGYFLHVEDIDLCRRARDMGGEVWFAPGALALHYGSTSQVSRLMIERAKARGLSRYFRKFARTPLERAFVSILGPAIGGMIILRALLVYYPKKLLLRR